MDKNKKLSEELLKIDGIDPVNITDAEREMFKTMLDKEMKNINKTSWRSFGLVWITQGVWLIFVVGLIGLALAHQALGIYQIPIIIAWVILMLVLGIKIFRKQRDYFRQMNDSGRKAQKLNLKIYGKHKGLVLVCRKNGKRCIRWSNVFIFTLVVWFIAFIPAVGVYHLLGSLGIGSIQTTIPMEMIIKITIAIFIFMALILSQGLKAPMEELGEIKAENYTCRRRKFSFITLTLIITAFGLFILFGKGTLYAQVLDAWKEVRTMHLSGTEYRDGQLFEEGEIWYDREKGIIEQKRYRDRTDIRIDNGEYELRYALGQETVTKTKSYKDKYAIIRSFSSVTWLKHNPERIPSGDLTIDEMPCSMYLIKSANGSKISFWIDDKNRIRKIKIIEESQIQNVVSEAIIEYDIEIDQNLFSPEFGPDMQFTNLKELIEKQYPLETAIFTRENKGLVFSIHEAKVCENGIKFLVCSTRFNTEIRRKIGTGNQRAYQIQLYNNYDHFMHIAYLEHDEINIGWFLLIPRKNISNQTYEHNIDVYIEGLPVSEKFSLLIKSIGFKEDNTSLDEITNNIFSLGKKLDPVVHSFQLMEFTEGNTEDGLISVGRRPVIEISEENYQKNIENQVKKWIRQYQ